MSILDNRREPRRKSVSLRGSTLLLLSFQTLGVVYSDLGTSPLYTLNGIWPANGPLPPAEDVIGGVSAIIWAITLLPLIKYVTISLFFGTGEGEGGTFALYQGLYPPADYDYETDRTLTYQEHKSDLVEKLRNAPVQRKISRKLRLPLLVWCLFGTALTMADGIFTPAVSVTRAVFGIAVAKPSVTNDVIPISIAFLVGLFLLQQFGTYRISFLFAPIAFLWFLSISIIGIYNITFYPGILRAFDPSRAVMLFVRTKRYDYLMGVILALTGCEATFANLGQFNATSIRIAFSFVVYPSVLLSYMGQGSQLIVNGEKTLPNPFWNTIPGQTNGPIFWCVYVVCMLALLNDIDRLVASQSMISATSSLFQQVINMKSFPPLQMICTSDVFQGQVYIPAVNWVLMTLTIVVVAAFGDSQKLTNAYGFSVATVMFSTSILLAVSMYYVKLWHWTVSVMFVVFFGFFDGLLWGAALRKVPEGAWVPLMIGIILGSSMLLWTWGKRLEDRFDGANRQSIARFIQEDNGIDKQTTLDDSSAAELINQVPGLSYLAPQKRTDFADLKGSEIEEKRELVRISACAIFYKFSRGPGVPHTFVAFIRKWPSLPRVVVFLSVCVLPVARVPLEGRYVVKKVRSIEGIYGVTYYLGFRDEFHIEHDALANKVCASELQSDPNVSPSWLAEIKTLIQGTTHMVPHYHVVSRKTHEGVISAVGAFIRKWLLEDVYRRIATMFPDTANWLTPADEIMQVGITAFV
ncbi:potassium transporter [Amanita rubescens]|nr:potassium transporter [Amanita rubescens]